MPSNLTAAFENLGSRNEFKRKSAVQELAQAAESSAPIIAALMAARESDPHADVRQAAAQALLAPVHRAFLEAHPDWADQAAAEAHQRQLMPNADMRQLQAALKSKSREEQLRAIYTIRHFRRLEALPDLAAAATSFSMLMSLQGGRAPDRQQAKALLLPILEALSDLGGPAQPDAKWQGFLKTGLAALASHIRASDEQKDLGDDEAQLNLKLARCLMAIGGPVGAEGVGKALFSPVDVTKSTATSHLRYVVAVDQLALDEARVRAALPWLFRGAVTDEERWTPKTNVGLAAGLLWAGFGTLLTTLVNSFVDGVARDLAARETVSVRSLLLLTPEAVAPNALAAASDQTRLLTAMHAYGTGLAKLAAAFPALIQAELARAQKPILRALLGFALALNDDPEVYALLRRLAVSISRDDWMIKLLANEGLIALANSAAGAGRVPEAEQVAALADHDLRISTSIAYVLLGTRNAAYLPHVAKLAGSDEAALRRAALPAVFGLAQSGDATARQTLAGLAQLDRDKEVREEAKKLVARLAGPAPV